MIKMPCHPRSTRDGGYVYEHIAAAELAFGRELMRREVVHHVDGDRTNQNWKNLIIFPGQSEHAKFHAAVRKGLVSSVANCKRFGGQTCKHPRLAPGGPFHIQLLAQEIVSGGATSLRRASRPSPQSCEHQLG